ncbi:MAG TPA: dihydrodipicolinate synthase family protein [Candidatus Acidoferrales bacterium]|nr:dihydrodipicolinate synthase family protein [Candidatus Acidoferrales bacterium]
MPDRSAPSGVFAPLTTPFDANDQLAAGPLLGNLARYNRTRLAGYVATGSTGEAILLSWPETESLWAHIAEAAGKDKVLVAGTAAESTAETIRRTRRAAELGYRYALVRTPVYYQPQMNADALTGYYRSIADASPIPVLIYSIPQFTGVTVEAPLVARLAEHPNIVGVKESSGSVQRIAEIIHATGPEFRVLAGSASTFFPSLMIGAAGGVLALACAMPEACVELYEAACAKDVDRARALQEKLLPASKVLVSQYGVAGIKYALDRLGYYGGPVRAPLRPVGEAARKDIDRVLAGIVAVESAVG